MKKLIKAMSVMAVLALAFSFTGCSGEEEDDDDESYTVKLPVIGDGALNVRIIPDGTDLKNTTWIYVDEGSYDNTPSNPGVPGGSGDDGYTPPSGGNQQPTYTDDPQKEYSNGSTYYIHVNKNNALYFGTVAYVSDDDGNVIEDSITYTPLYRGGYTVASDQKIKITFEKSYSSTATGSKDFWKDNAPSSVTQYKSSCGVTTGNDVYVGKNNFLYFQDRDDANNTSGTNYVWAKWNYSKFMTSSDGTNGTTNVSGSGSNSGNSGNSGNGGDIPGNIPGGDYPGFGGGDGNDDPFGDIPGYNPGDIPGYPGNIPGGDYPGFGGGDDDDDPFGDDIPDFNSMDEAKRYFEAQYGITIPASVQTPEQLEAYIMDLIMSGNLPH